MTIAYYSAVFNGQAFAGKLKKDSLESLLSAIDKPKTIEKEMSAEDMLNRVMGYNSVLGGNLVVKEV